MSGSVYGTPFASGELVLIRDYCGYGARGNGTIFFGVQYIAQYNELETKLANLSADEVQEVRNRMVDLATLKAALPGASATLEVDTAGPFIRNKQELSERVRLYDDWRRRLCQFLGVAPGTDLASRGGLQMVV